MTLVSPSFAFQWEKWLWTNLEFEKRIWFTLCFSLWFVESFSDALYILYSPGWVGGNNSTRKFISAVFLQPTKGVRLIDYTFFLRKSMFRDSWRRNPKEWRHINYWRWRSRTKRQNHFLLLTTRWLAFFITRKKTKQEAVTLCDHKECYQTLIVIRFLWLDQWFTNFSGSRST